MLLRQLFDRETSTYSYLLADEASGDAVIIDPVLEHVERDLALVGDLGLRLGHALDTHVHADHVSALGELRARTGCKTAMAADGGAGCVDVHVRDGDRIAFGRHALEVRATPGHTAGCLTYVTDDHAAAFTGDALLVRGCGRTDLQGGDAARLYRSVHQRIFDLPDATRVYPAHDYRGHPFTTVGEERRLNPRLGGGRGEADFVALMADLDLAQPARIHEAVPRNLGCGKAAPVGDGEPR